MKIVPWPYMFFLMISLIRTSDSIISNLLKIIKLTWIINWPFLYEQNEVRVHGLFGVDVIQFMKNIKIVDWMKGSPSEFPTEISLFSNYQNFLYKNLITPTKFQGKPQHNYHAIVSEYFTCLDTWVNFVMNPIKKKNYPGPFAKIFDESQVARNLEKMPDVDSRGISPEEQSVCELSKFLRWTLLIFIIKRFRTIVFIFIAISTRFRPSSGVCRTREPSRRTHSVTVIGVGSLKVCLWLL